MLILNHYFDGKTIDDLSNEEIKEVLSDPHISQVMFDLVCIEISRRMNINVEMVYRSLKDN